MHINFRGIVNRNKRKILHPDYIEESIRENLALELLRPYLPEKYFPYTKSSLQFNSLWAIVNDLIVNKRKNYLEFGSGISTILIAKFIKLNKLDIKITSIDHDKKWIKIVKNYLINENINEVEFIHAPLKKCKLSLSNTMWYDSEIIKNVIKNRFFDIILIDGPLAYKKENQFSRYPAVPFLQNNLNEKYNIFLDDTHRKGEQYIVKLWNKKFNTKFKKISSYFSYSIQGEGYNFV